MATISKFYLHDAATTNTGTMPTGAFLNSHDVTGDATGAQTARATSDVIGVLQTSAAFTSNANQLAQQWGFRRFVSPPLAAVVINGLYTFSAASSQSNTAHQQNCTCLIYAWRPSTGAQVGSSPVALTLGVAGTTETANSVSGTFGETLLDGDILVFEVYDQFTQTMSTAYTSTFFYDGTTEASTTSCASFVAPPSALTLYVPPPGLPFYFDPIPFVSPGRI